MWIIITGSIMAGFEFTGPFDSRESARQYADDNKHLIADAEIVKLQREYK